jgi:hypothetical protein
VAYGYNPSYNPSVNYFGNPYTPMNNQAGPMQPQQPVQMGQPVQQMTDQQPGTLFARYVASREEAVAAMVVSDGRLNLFVDEQHGMIYGKAVAPNGAASFRDFASRQPVQQTAEPQQSQRWAPMEVVEQLRAEIQQLKDMFRERGGEQ